MEEKKTKVVTCYTNSYKHIQDNIVQLNPVTNWLCHMICSYPAMLIRRLVMISLTYILFLIYNNTHYKYVLLLHIRFPNAFSSILRHGHRLPRAYRQEEKAVLKLSYKSLICSSQTFFFPNSSISNMLQSQ